MFESNEATVNTPVQKERMVEERIIELEEPETTRHETTIHTTGELFDDFEPFSNINLGMVLGVTISSFVIACLVFAFLIQKKKAPRGRFMRWLREFLNFRSILIAGIIKFLYVFLAVVLTITSIIVMFQGRDDTVLTMILIGLAMLIIGNILLRITMELTMAIISMWDNTSDIRGVLVKEEEKPIEKTPKEPEPEKEVATEGQAKEQPSTTTGDVVVEQPSVATSEVAAEQPPVAANESNATPSIASEPLNIPPQQA